MPFRRPRIHGHRDAQPRSTEWTERFLETGKGKRYLRNRLAAFLSEITENKLERY